MSNKPRSFHLIITRTRANKIDYRILILFGELTRARSRLEAMPPYVAKPGGTQLNPAAPRRSSLTLLVTPITP